MNIPENYLERFEIRYPDTLFPPVWSNLKVNKCPLCSRKMIYLGEIVICKGGKKHAKAFVVKRSKLSKLQETLKNI